MQSADRSETLVPTLSGIMAISSFVRDFQSYLSVTITILSGIPIITHFDFIQDFNFACPLSNTPLSKKSLAFVSGKLLRKCHGVNDISVREYEFANTREV